MIAIAIVLLLAGFLLFLPLRSAFAATTILRPNGLGVDPVGQGIPDNEDGLDATDDFSGLPSFGSIRWMDVDDDPSHDGDTSYVETTDDDNGDLYSLTDPAFATGTVVNSVQLCAVMRRASSDQRGGFFGLKSGTTEHWGSKVEWPGIGSGNDTAYAQYCRTYTTDPNTGSGWTKSALNALQVGFFSNDDFNSGLRATQIFVTVDSGAVSSASASSVASASTVSSSSVPSSVNSMSSMSSMASSVMSSVSSSVSSMIASSMSSSSGMSSVSSMSSPSSGMSSSSSSVPPGGPAPQCNGKAATIYVSNGMIVGGRDEGDVYDGELRGSWGADVIVGTEGADAIKGRAGDDTICGLGGEDDLDGGFGDDWMDGGMGRDTMDGGIGMDTLYGRDGDDDLNGGLGDDRLFGGAGKDRADGKMGEDIACGGAGDDVLDGGMGDDDLDGGSGSGTNALNGGMGSDLCVNGASPLRCEVTTGTVPECAGM